MSEAAPGRHLDSAELQAFADGEDIADDAMAHIEACGECRAEVASIRRVTAALSLTSRPPELLTERVREARNAESRLERPLQANTSVRRKKLYLIPAGLAAAAALALFVPREVTPPSGDSKTGPTGVVFRTVLSEWSQSAADSIARAMNDRRASVELVYSSDSSRGAMSSRQLADSVGEFLRAKGVADAAIRMRQLPRGTESSATEVRVIVRAVP